MRKKVILITGACGEIGHALIEQLTLDASNELVTLDLQDLPESVEKKVQRHIKGSILDKMLLDNLASEYEIDVKLRLERHTGSM